MGREELPHVAWCWRHTTVTWSASRHLMVIVFPFLKSNSLLLLRFVLLVPAYLSCWAEKQGVYNSSVVQKIPSEHHTIHAKLSFSGNHNRNNKPHLSLLTLESFG
jgi:hypothetical protein